MANHLIKRLAGATVLAIAVTACGTSPEMVRQADREFQSIRDTAPLVKDRVTIDYVACVTNAIIDVLEGDDADMFWELVIVDHPMIQAQAMAGGKVIIYSGILSVTANQDQLAAVIGHEIAHVTENHTGQKKAQYEAAGFAIDVGASILGGGYYGQTAAAGSALSQLATYGVLYPFSRGMESEADIVGLDFMAKAGFDPRESANLWQNMDAKKESKVPAYMTTHPSAETRIDDLVSRYPKALALYNQAQAEGRYPDCRQP